VLDVLLTLSVVFYGKSFGLIDRQVKRVKIMAKGKNRSKSRGIKDDARPRAAASSQGDASEAVGGGSSPSGTTSLSEQVVTSPSPGGSTSPPMAFGTTPFPVERSPSGSRGPSTSRPGTASGSRPSSSTSSSGVERVTNKLQVTSLAEGGDFGKLARKRSPGIVGAKIWVVTNMFRLSLRKVNVAYHYDVEVMREKKAGVLTEATRTEKKKSFPMFETELKKANGPFHGVIVVYDGNKNLFSYNQPLRIAKFKETKKLTIDGVEGEYVLEVKPADKYPQVESGDGSTKVSNFINIDQQNMTEASLLAVEIGVSYVLGKELLSRGKSDFFDRKFTGDLIRNTNLTLMTGFRKSVRVTESGLVINIDQASGVFQRAGKLIDVIKNILDIEKYGGLKNFSMTANLAHMLTQELGDSNRGCQVMVPMDGYQAKKRIFGFTPHSVQQVTFPFGPKGQEENITVYEYYKNHRNPKVTLKYPNLPCIVLPNRKTFIPVEMCYLLPDQYFLKKLSSSVQSFVTRNTVTPPTPRMTNITQSVDTVARAAGLLEMDIDLQASEAPARVIDPPTMKDGMRSTVKPEVNPQRGNPCDFRINKLVKGVTLKNWAVAVIISGPAVLPEAQAAVTKWIKNLSIKSGQLGMLINPTFVFGGRMTSDGKDLSKIEKFLLDIKEKNKNIQMILVLIPNSDAVYRAIKTVGNRCEIATQCLVLDISDTRDMDSSRGKLSKISNPTFLQNMVYKMNAKLGGENQRLELANVASHISLLKKPGLMVMGIDISHPGVGDDDLKHSIAGFVASFTSDLTTYICATRSQKKLRQEVIQEDIETVGEVADVFFRKYFEVNKMYPELLVVYRDGVSQGQFSLVKSQEVPQLRKAMEKLNMKCDIVYVTVQKRHHFRMVNKKVDERTGKLTYDNVKPGTVVDEFVVHPERFECYLNSHHALQGTAKPSHYCVIHDDTENRPDAITSDQMQHLSYYLCYVFARCMKPISQPAPTRYAHLVCEQAAGWVKTMWRSGVYQERQIDDFCRVSKFQQDKLFYC